MTTNGSELTPEKLESFNRMKAQIDRQLAQIIQEEREWLKARPSPRLAQDDLAGGMDGFNDPKE